MQLSSTILAAVAVGAGPALADCVQALHHGFSLATRYPCTLKGPGFNWICADTIVYWEGDRIYINNQGGGPVILQVTCKNNPKLLDYEECTGKDTGAIEFETSCLAQDVIITRLVLRN
ncbi:hypothetical protein E4U53_004500 [Claviceps sorghi]|nr:hypothetical protein E4U53_004500 [Claviceps sorghi]